MKSTRYWYTSGSTPLRATSNRCALPVGGVAALESRCLVLSSDALVVKDEAECFRALTRWLAAQQPAASAEIQARLLGCVRFDLMSHAFVQQHVNTEPLVTASNPNLMIVLQAFQRSTFAEKSRPRIGGAIELRFESAFDTNGVLYHIGTEGGMTAAVRHALRHLNWWECVIS